MYCQFCNKNGDFVKAHIIPEAFFRELREGGETPRMINTNPNLHMRRSPIGIYDEKILCKQCESIFGVWDDYGINLILKNIHSFNKMMNGTELVGLTLDEFDYSKLKLFFLSVLWRAHHSQHDFYASIRLGNHEKNIKEMLKSENAGFVDDYTVVLSHFESKRNLDKLIKTIMEPFREKWGINGINAYRLYFGKIVAYIKVGKRPFNNGLAEVALAPNKQLLLVNRVFEESKDINPMITLAKRMPRIKI